MTSTRGCTVRVFVRDVAGMPVGGAAVEAVTLSPDPIPPSTTTPDGIATLSIPADVQVYNVLALKPRVGLDYFENYQSWPPGRQLSPPPPEVHLVLDGAREVSVQAVDSVGRLLPNVPLTPWTVKKEGKLADVNCSGSRLTDVRTDAGGLARFTWIPGGLEGVTQFLVRDGAYHCPCTPWIDPTHPDRPLTARLLRNTRVAGRVLFPDGRPAAGITVRAEGRGWTNFYCRREAKSGPDGTYDFLVFPDQSYILTVFDDAWAARSLQGVRAREGGPLTGLDLHLLRGTRLHGRITLGPAHEPAGGQTVTLWEQGGDLGEGLRGHFKKEELVRWAGSAESGRYELRLGPGRYRLEGPGPGAAEEDLVVEAEEEVVRDFHLPYLPRGPLTGDVRRAGEEGQAVSHAVVRGESAVRGHASFETSADGEGVFSSERWRERMLVYARDPQGAGAGHGEIAEQDGAVTVRTSPAATARGRVVDRDGALLSTEHVFCRMRLALRDGTPVTFQIETRTDIAGVFLLPGLPVGASCDVSVLRGHERITPWFPFTVSKAGVVELPDFVLEGPAGADGVTRSG